MKYIKYAVTLCTLILKQTSLRSYAKRIFSVFYLYELAFLDLNYAVPENIKRMKIDKF